MIITKHLTMRWSERRTAVRSTFEMTSTFWFVALSLPSGLPVYVVA